MPATSSPDKTNLTLMFVDVCGSTSLYESLGDAPAQQKINGLLNGLRTTALRHGGRVVKEIGDESMLVFDRSDDALALARELPLLQQQHQLQCKTGIHAGQVIAQDNDVFGDAVNTAARIVGLAAPGQILFSQQALETLAYRPQTRALPPMSVRGKQQALQLAELVEDQQADYTQVLDAGELASLRENHAATLKLTWAEGNLELKGSGISIGRENDNNLVVPLPHISRVHLRIEPQGNHWLIHDQSTNGTLLREQGAAPLLLRHEQHRLLDAGTLHLIPAEPDNPAATVHYRIQLPD